jgi:hypothetical protein
VPASASSQSSQQVVSASTHRSQALADKRVTVSASSQSSQQADSVSIQSLPVSASSQSLQQAEHVSSQSSPPSALAWIRGILALDGNMNVGCRLLIILLSLLLSLIQYHMGFHAGMRASESEPRDPQSEPQRGGHVSEPCETQSSVSEPCEPAEREQTRREWAQRWDAREQQHRKRWEVHVQRWDAREQQHQDLVRRLLRALSLVRPYVPVAIWNTKRSDFDSQREQPSEPQRGGRSVEVFPPVALVLPGALPTVAVALSERVTAPVAVATAEEPAAAQLPLQDVRVRPSHVPRYYVQDWSTGEWLPWRLLQQRLAARRELQRPRGTRMRGCRGGRCSRSRRTDAHCMGVMRSARGLEERQPQC